MTGRILIVDDLSINVKLLEAKLSAEYFQVLTASNGQAALEIAAAELPDVVLLDVMMPHMDGFEVCRRLKTEPRTADLPVVMVTALSDTAYRLHGLEVGADDFLTKPVSDIALFARVRSLVRLRRLIQEWRLRDEICGHFGGGPPAALDHGPARIMIVEEDPLAAAQIASPLATHKVTVAANCAAAQAQLGRDTDLVIASLTPDDRDALHFVSYCRASEALRQTPILLIAGERDLPRLAKGLDLGANDYLVRPIDPNELVARTNIQLRRRRLQHSLDQNYRRSLALALTDELTGLYNRRYLFAHLAKLIARVNGDGVAAALLCSISIISSGSTIPTAIRAATRSCSKSHAARATACAATISSPVSAGKNSRWSCPRPGSTSPQPSPSGCAAPWRTTRFGSVTATRPVI